MIPDCYEPWVQEERRQRDWDRTAQKYPVCTLCNRRIYPGNVFRTAHYQIVCLPCCRELEDGEEEYVVGDI